MVKLSDNIVVLSVILYLGLLAPLTIFHELGHAVVCSADGFSYVIYFDNRGGHTLCHNVVHNPFLSNIMGPAFGLIASCGILATFRFAIRNYALLAVGLAYVVDQGMKLFLEGFVPSLYNFRLDMPILLVQLASWTAFALYYQRKRHLELAQLSTD